MTEAPKTIKSFEWINGRFGTNTAELVQVRDGYLVYSGYSDPYFYADVDEAESAYVAFTENKEAA